MRLSNGIAVDAEKTLGALKFSAMRREKMAVDDEGKSTGEVLERTYDLRSRGQGMMVQVSIPAESGKKEISAGTPVKLIEPVFDTVVSTSYNRADVDWYIKAKDIVPVANATENLVLKSAEKDAGGKKENKDGAKN